MGKPTTCLGENKGTDHFHSNCEFEADQRLCLRYTDSTISLLSNFKISSLYPSSVTVQSGLLGLVEPQIVCFLTHRLKLIRLQLLLWWNPSNTRSIKASFEKEVVVVDLHSRVSLF